MRAFETLLKDDLPADLRYELSDIWLLELQELDYCKESSVNLQQKCCLLFLLGQICDRQLAL